MERISPTATSSVLTRLFKLLPSTFGLLCGARITVANVLTTRLCPSSLVDLTFSRKRDSPEPLGLKHDECCIANSLTSSLEHTVSTRTANDCETSNAIRRRAIAVLLLIASPVARK